MAQSLLVAQHEALSNFLDDLLAEETEESLPVEQGSVVDADAEEIAEPEVLPVLEPAPVVAEVPLPEPVSPVNVVPVMEDGRVPVLPNWGLKPFQAMVFKVGDLSLAIPLTELAGVIEWKPEQLQGDTGDGLCLGHCRHDGRSVTVVDIARLVFAGSQFEHLPQVEAGQRVSRIILIDGARLGLAVDAVFEVITIQPTRVNWRSVRTRRQWLAGTMLDDMIVVLDAQSTTRILSDLLA